jgi:hypothetical protein
MKFTGKALLDMNVGFHDALEILPDPELRRLLSTFSGNGMQFLSWAPPIFCQNGASHFTLIAGYLSFCIMTTCITQSTEITVISKNELTAARLENYKKWDRKLYSGLLMDDSSSDLGVSRPTFIKRMRLKSGQACPFCKGSAALTADDDWRSRVKESQEGTLKCPQCKASIPVTAHELEKFQDYDLPTDALELSRWKRILKPTDR